MQLKSCGDEVQRVCGCARHAAPLYLTHPVVASDLPAPPGTSSAPCRAPRGARLGCFLPRKQPGLGLSQQPDRPEGSQRATEHGVHPASRGKTPPWGAKSGEKWEQRPPWRYGKGSAASALSQSCFHAAPKAPEGLSHDQTVESGTRSRENIKTHSFFSHQGQNVPVLRLYSHIHM